MIVYVSGPVSGRPDLNRPIFEIARRKIEEIGHKAIIPIDLCWDLVDGPCKAFIWTACMVRCLDALDRADAILMLEGWQDSRGARIERQKAKEKRLKIVYA